MPNRASTMTKCDLNKTWTILPDDDDDGVGEKRITTVDDQRRVRKDGDEGSCDTDGALQNQLKGRGFNMVPVTNTIYRNMQRKMCTLLELFNISDDNFESLFDETYFGIEFADGDPIVTSNPTSPSRRRNSSIIESVERRNRCRSTITKSQMNVTIDIEPTLSPECIKQVDAFVQAPNSFTATTTTTTSSSSSSPLSSAVNNQLSLKDDDDDNDDSNDSPCQQQGRIRTTKTIYDGYNDDNCEALLGSREIVVDTATKKPFDTKYVPNTFDLFRCDIRKSSSTLDIHNAAETMNVEEASPCVPVNCNEQHQPQYMNCTFNVSSKLLNTKIVDRTTSIDKEFFDDDAQIECINSKNTDQIQPNLGSTKLELRKSNLPRIISSKIADSTISTTEYRKKLASVPQPNAKSNMESNKQNKQQQFQQTSFHRNLSRQSNGCIKYSPTNASSQIFLNNAATLNTTKSKTALSSSSSSSFSIPCAAFIPSDVLVSAKSPTNKTTLMSKTNTIESTTNRGAAKVIPPLSTLAITNSTYLNRLSSNSSSSSTLQSSIKENMSKEVKSTEWTSNANTNSKPSLIRLATTLPNNQHNSTKTKTENSSSSGLVSKLKPPSVIVSKSTAVATANASADTIEIIKPVHNVSRINQVGGSQTIQTIQSSKIPSISKASSSRPLSSVYGI